MPESGSLNSSLYSLILGRINHYEQYTSGSYSAPSVGTYTEAETAILKKFYRSLSKTYHPDLNPGLDTTAEMQLLNKLKEAWGV